MNFMRTAIGIAFLVAFAALSPVAAAETVVPPGNSAATQYTETFPTSNGEADVNKEIDASNLEPSKVLGKNKTHALESHGNDGKQVAIITAVTAPKPVTEEPVAEEPEQTSHSHESKPAPAKGNGDGGGGKQAHPAQGKPESGDAQAAHDASVRVAQPSGSSGVGEVIGQATGADSGELGLLLPLVLIGTVVVSFTYAWRQRREAG